MIRPGSLSRSTARRSAEAGFVTAEFAACLPAVVLFLLLGMFAVSVAGAQLRCVDAAREAALAASRGETATATALKYAPPNAQLRLTPTQDQVRAEVTAEVSPYGDFIPPIHLTANATAAVEPEAMS